MRNLYLALGALFVVCGAAEADQWPTRPIELIIPFSAGGGPDTTARVIAHAMSADLKQTIVISNRDGASGSIGFSSLAAAAPDGYVLGGGPTTPITSASYLIKGLRYTINSFDYVCQTFDDVFALAVPAESRFKTAQELFAAARVEPGKLLYGHAGVSSNSHLSAESLGKSLGLRFQPVVFRGTAPMMQVLLKGDLDFAIPTLIGVRDQNARILVVFTEQRLASLPDVPTARELGAASVPTVNGLYAPKGLPEAVRSTLENSCRNAMQRDDVAGFIVKSGQVPSFAPGAVFRDNTEKDLVIKGALMRDVGLLPP